MDLSSQSRRSIFGYISKLMVIALVIQVTGSDINSDFSDDQIPLQIIENELRQLQVNILQPNKEIQHQYTATRHFNLREIVAIEKVVNNFQETLIRLNTSTPLNLEDQLKLYKSVYVIEEMQKTLHILKQNHTLGGSEVNDASIGSSENENDINTTLEKILLDGAVSAIQNREFSLAEEQLQLTSNVTYEKAVDTVYNYSDQNLKLIQKFYDSVTNVDSKFKIIKGLYKSITSDELRNFRTFTKIVGLGQILRKDVLNHTSDIVAEQLLFDTMANAIREQGIQVIADNFMHFDVELISLSDCIGNAFLENFTPFARDFYEQAINKVADKLNFEQMIEAADRKTTHLESEILAHHVIFNKLESKGLLNTNYSLLLAISMRRAMIDSCQSKYQNLSSEWRSPYENLKNKLPATVKNLVFSSSVCIKSSYQDEYLFAADTEFGGYGHDPQRHSVYTWIPKNETNSTEFKWRVKFTINNEAELIYVKSGEKLFGNESNHFDEERRMVFTTQSKLTNPFISGQKTFWNFEVDGEGFQLKNAKSKEYLYADAEKKLDDKRRYVFTNATKRKTKDSKWEIFDCSDSS